MMKLIYFPIEEIKNLWVLDLFKDIMNIGKEGPVENDITGTTEEIPYYIGAMVYKDVKSHIMAVIKKRK